MVIGGREVLVVAVVALLAGVGSGWVTESVSIGGKDALHLRYDRGWGAAAAAGNSSTFFFSRFPRRGSFRLSELGARLKLERDGSRLERREGVEHVINGDLVGDTGLFPEVVMLAIPVPEADFLYVQCTGTLLAENIVLTAGHCTNFYDNASQKGSGQGELYVCSGSTDLTQADSDHVCSLVVEGYTQGRFDDELLVSGNDIALIRTESSLLVEGVQIGRVSLEPALYGTLSYAVGFGVHTFNREIVEQGIMRFKEGLFIPADRCRAVGKLSVHTTNDPLYVCLDTNYDNSGGSVCNGDSGSPIVVRGSNPQDNYIVGVLSYGIQPLLSTVSCDPYYEGVYGSLSAESNRKFLVETMEMLGGTLLVVESPEALTCKGRMALCESLPGDRGCLDENGAALASCCPESISEIRCLQAVAEDCDDEDMKESLQVSLETYDELCVPQYVCGTDDVSYCTSKIEASCEDLVGLEDYYNYFIQFSTTDCCDARLDAETCLLQLAKKCVGNDIVMEAIKELKEDPLCEGYRCTDARIRNCEAFFFLLFGCEQTLLNNSDVEDVNSRSSCCSEASQIINCLNAVIEDCPARKPAVVEDLERVKSISDAGHCPRDEPDRHCTVAECSARFRAYCDVEKPYELEYNLYYYNEGHLSLQQEAWCCLEAEFALDCLEYQKRSCGPDYEELHESEAATVQSMLSALNVDCEALPCDPAQCDLIPRNPGETGLGIPDNGCAELNREVRCLDKLSRRCGDEDGQIAEVLETIEGTAVELECPPLDCASRALSCYSQFNIRRCDASRLNERCCAIFEQRKRCLQTAADNGCEDDPSVQTLLLEVTSDITVEQCNELVCPASNCMKKVPERNCASTQLWRRRKCCIGVSEARECLLDGTNYDCPEEIDERAAALAELESEYTEQECPLLACEDAVRQCVSSFRALCRGDESSTSCCELGAQAMDCLTLVRSDCSSFPDVVEEANARIGYVERTMELMHPCDPCHGLCSEEEGMNCVLDEGGKPFCANCAGLLKPSPRDSTDAECCYYDAEKMVCSSALRSRRPNVCRSTDDLFYITDDGTREEATGLTRKYVCSDLWAMKRLGLACQIYARRLLTPRCLN